MQLSALSFVSTDNFASHVVGIPEFFGLGSCIFSQMSLGDGHVAVLPWQSVGPSTVSNSIVYPTVFQLDRGLVLNISPNVIGRGVFMLLTNSDISNAKGIPALQASGLAHSNFFIAMPEIHTLLVGQACDPQKFSSDAPKGVPCLSPRPG
jgi:hypothetical protein